MTDAVSTERRTLARQLREGGEALTNEIAELIESTIDEVRRQHVEPEWIRLSTRANFDALAHLVVNPEDLHLAELPMAAMSLVRELARHGVPLHEITRSYQLSQGRWHQICTRLLSTLITDVDTFAIESLALAELCNDYMDRMCQRLAAEYSDERGRWIRQDESLRTEHVMALLSGRGADSATERVLGYQLGQQHRAVIAWADPASTSGDELIRAQRAVAVFAAAVNCAGLPLVVARDARTVWAWLPGSTLEAAGAARADMELDVERLEIKLAMGAIQSHTPGFIASHNQASAAQQVGRLSKAAVFPYDEVSALTFLAADIDRARSWVREVLGPLTDGSAREAELRRTLRVFLQCHHSATQAAAKLNCHKNTVLYRLRTIERLRGRAVNDDPVDAALALHACTWLGEHLLGT